MSYEVSTKSFVIVSVHAPNNHIILCYDGHSASAG